MRIRLRMRMDAIPCRLVFLALFFGARIQHTEGLQCFCHRCPNHTCVTDGLCYVSITKSGGSTTQQTSCISENELIPRDRPFICASSTKHDSGIYPMCCNTDWCNKNPDPSTFTFSDPAAAGPSSWPGESNDSEVDVTMRQGIQGIQTVSKISVQKQQTITIPCLYDKKYVNYPKYMSRGGVWIYSGSVTHSRMSVEDDPAVKVFTATLREAEVSDSGTYWCAVSMSGSDPHTYLYLQVTEAEPGLRVSSQTVSGYEGGNVTILCHGASHWCTIRGSCAGRDGGSLERTAVRDDDGSVLRVTLYQLQKEDGGWYYCANEDSQMPVHLTVMEALEITQFTALDTTQFTTYSSYCSTPPSADSASLDFRQFLWLLLLGAMLLITVCAAVMLIRARNTRKQRAESSNLHDHMNTQQLTKEQELAPEITSSILQMCT